MFSVCWDGIEAYSCIIWRADDGCRSIVTATDITLPLWQEEETCLISGSDEQREECGCNSQKARDSRHFRSSMFPLKVGMPSSNQVDYIYERNNAIQCDEV